MEKRRGKRKCVKRTKRTHNYAENIICTHKDWRQRWGLHMAVCAMAVLLCTGCGDTYGESNSILSEDYSMDSVNSSMAGGSLYGGDGFQTAESDMRTENASQGIEGITDARKLITTVRLELETKEFEQTMSGIEGQIRNMGGYIESMEAYNGSSYTGSRASRYADMTIRVPASQMNGFMDMICGTGNIVRRSDDVKDVTLSYVDMEGRRDTLRTEQSRLLDFLDKADSVETIITLEERLSEVRYQLESMESQLRTIDNLVEYSTVVLKITEVKELTPAAEQTAWERIETGFAESLHHIGDGIVDAGVWVAVNSPYLVIWAVVIGAAAVILRKSGQKRRSKKEMKNGQAMKKEQQTEKE